MDASHATKGYWPKQILYVKYSLISSIISKIWCVNSVVGDNRRIETEFICIHSGLDVVEFLVVSSCCNRPPIEYWSSVDSS